LVLRGYGLEAYSWAIIARGIVGVITIYILQRWPLGFALDKVALKTILGTGIKFQASDLLARFKDNLTYLIIGWMLPNKEFGYITFAKQFSQMPYNMTVQNVIAITFPAYSRLQKDTVRLGKAIEKTLFFISLSIFPILGGMVVFVQPLTEVVTEYQKWQPAIPLFILMTLSIGWGAISTPLTNTLNAIGQINTTLKLMLMWTALTWILVPISIWQFGFTGVGVAAFLISFSSVLPIYYVKKTIPIQAWSQVWRQLLATVVMVVVGYLGLDYWGQNIWWLLTGMIIVGSSYLVSFGLIGWRRLAIELQSLRNKS
jgi:O-antigen/teichoic acid export membrane protein